MDGEKWDEGHGELGKAEAGGREGRGGELGRVKLNLIQTLRASGLVRIV